MNSLKSLARDHAVGGTARWAAQGYIAFTNSNQGASIEFADVCKALVRHRFLAMPDSQQESTLLALADNLVGLRGLVVAVLTVEAEFADNEPEMKQMFMEVIDEELLKYGLPDEVVFGRRQTAKAAAERSDASSEEKLNFSCPDCGQKFFALQEHTGRRMRCSQCGVSFRIPRVAEDKRDSPCAEVEQPAQASDLHVDAVERYQGARTRVNNRSRDQVSSSAKFGDVFISGVLSIVVGIGGVGVGCWLTMGSGIWPILGWPLMMFALHFTVWSACTLWRITRLQLAAVRMMRDEPEAFESLRRQYYEAMRST